MELKSVKKDVENLPNILEEVDKLKVSWVKPVKQMFLPQLDNVTQKALKKEISMLTKILNNVSLGQGIHQKLRQQARYLVEIKLNEFRNDSQKSQVLTNRLLNDEVFSMQQTKQDITSFRQEVAALQEQLQIVSAMVQSNLTLESNVDFHELPQQKVVDQLNLISESQEEVMQRLGQQFSKLKVNS
jgi:hypothetical protein